MKRFIQGMVFMSVMLPIFDAFSNIIAQLTKHACTAIAVKTYELEKSIPQDEPEYCTNAIGFQVDDPVDYEEEDDF